MKRLDHSMILVGIAATYTPLAFNMFSGWWRIGILGAAWGAALIGVGTAVAGVHLHRWARAGLYVAMGWIAVAGCIWAYAVPYLIYYGADVGSVARSASLAWVVIGTAIAGYVSYNRVQ